MSCFQSMLGAAKVLMVFATLGLAGCATSLTPISNNTDISKVDFSKVSSMKSGKSCAKWYFIFGPFGTQSLVNAAVDGKLTKVELVDTSIESGFMTHSRCTIAYGQ
ncbi:MAG: TRL domain-containing protein [Pseudomonadota bacterium]